MESKHALETDWAVLFGLEGFQGLSEMVEYKLRKK